MRMAWGLLLATAPAALTEVVPSPLAPPEAMKAADVTRAGAALLGRVLPPSHAASFSVEHVAADSATGHEVLEYEAGSVNGTVVLRGSSPVAVASALQWFLKDVAREFASCSWSALPPFASLPTPLPKPAAKRRMVRPVRFSWYMNVCTPSYSFVWWDWERWEKEIDLMALQGVNIMYAHTGAEYVQAEVWTKLLGDNATQGLDDFLTGPAFLAWFRMGNMQKFGGPMPRSFLEQQHALQLKILPRLQTLGIVAVLPAFAGFVPRALKYAYPNASITAGALWLHSAEYSGVDVLSANDPLFTSIGKAFIDGYATAYAVANYTLQHYYSADTFNENAPASSDPAFLKAYAAATHRAMVAGDAQAVWVCQAWAFGSGFWTNGILEAYLSGVSNSSMLLLDLVSDQMPLWDGQWAALHDLMPAPPNACPSNKSASCADCDGECADPTTAGQWAAKAKNYNYKNYFGKPWIYCALNNYGGNNGNFGLLPTVLRAPAAAHKKVAAQGLNNMVGVGLTMEGIHTNWIINEALLSNGWQFYKDGESTDSDLNQWVADFAARRYSSANTQLATAWSHLANFSETSVYNGPRGSYFSSWGNTRAIFTHRPFWLSGSAAMWELGSLQTGDNSGFMGTAPRYNPKQLIKALRSLLAAVAADPGLKQSKSLAVDVIDLTATTMANLYILHITDLFLVTNGTMTAASPGKVKMIATELISAIAATDELLASNENYLLGKWISNARSFGTTDAEKALLEFNARNQVTMWGPGIFLENKQHTGGTVGNPQDYASKTWAGLYGTFYQTRQQLLIDMLGDAVDVAAASGAAVNFTVLAPNFTNASVRFELAWGQRSAPNETFSAVPTGDTFEQAAAALSKYGSKVEAATWCELRDQGHHCCGGDYRTDKEGVMHYWVPPSHIPADEAAGQHPYLDVQRCG